MDRTNTEAPAGDGPRQESPENSGSTRASIPRSTLLLVIVLGLAILAGITVYFIFFGSSPGLLMDRLAAGGLEAQPYVSDRRTVFRSSKGESDAVSEWSIRVPRGWKVLDAGEVVYIQPPPGSDAETGKAVFTVALADSDGLNTSGDAPTGNKMRLNGADAYDLPPLTAEGYSGRRLLVTKGDRASAFVLLGAASASYWEKHGNLIRAAMSTFTIR